MTAHVVGPFKSAAKKKCDLRAKGGQTNRVRDLEQIRYFHGISMSVREVQRASLSSTGLTTIQYVLLSANNNRSRGSMS